MCATVIVEHVILHFPESAILVKSSLSLKHETFCLEKVSM